MTVPTVYSALISNPAITLDELAAECQMTRDDADQFAAGWLAMRFQESVRRQASEAFRLVVGCEVVVRSTRPQVFGHYTVTHHAIRNDGFSYIDGIELGKRSPRRVSWIDVTCVKVRPNFFTAFRGWTTCPSFNDSVASIADAGMTPFHWNVLCDFISDHPNWFTWENHYGRGFTAELLTDVIRGDNAELYCGPAITTAEIEHANRNPRPVRTQPRPSGSPT